ncbi:uncharacterized protein LOC142984237 [Anticarsia gemmatalis]|uniref:uncharacterized protein LOC142984237 n=1 Tax=Anticarsia gemmatalis TaxID=129554 RepID=UPI003F760690
MHTMKCILVDIIFICVIAKTLAEQPSSELDIGKVVEFINSLRIKHAEEVKNDREHLQNDEKLFGRVKYVPVEHLLVPNPNIETKNVPNNNEPETQSLSEIEPADKSHKDFPKSKNSQKKVAKSEHVAKDPNIINSRIGKVYKGNANNNYKARQNENSVSNHRNQKVNNKYQQNWKQRYDNFEKYLRSQLDLVSSKQYNRGGNNENRLSKFKKYSLYLFKRFLRNNINNADFDTSGMSTKEKIAKLTVFVKNKLRYYLSNFKIFIHEIVIKFLRNVMLKEKFNEKTKQDSNRPKRYTQLRQGYSQAPDACKKYSENLEIMWSKLSKYINSTEPVDKTVLHNIVVMIEGYFEHLGTKEKTAVTRQARKNDKIGKILKKVNKLLGKHNAEEKIQELIKKHFKPKYTDEDPECRGTNENILASAIDLSYKNYLDNSKCHGDYDAGSLRQVYLATTLKNDYMTQYRELNDNNDPSILKENETSEDFQKSRVPDIKRFQHRLVNQNSQNSNRESDIFQRKSKKSKKKSRKLKSHNGDPCVKYASRKFLLSLRNTIERFLALHDCQEDDTLRSSDKKGIIETYVPHTKLYENIEHTPNPKQAKYKQLSQNHSYKYIGRSSNNYGQIPQPEGYKSMFVAQNTAYENPASWSQQNEERNVAHVLNYKYLPPTISGSNYAANYIVQASSSLPPYLNDKAIGNSLNLNVNSKNTAYSNNISVRNPMEENSKFELYERNEHINNKMEDLNKSPVDTIARENGKIRVIEVNREDLVNDDEVRGTSTEKIQMDYDAVVDIIKNVHNISLQKPQVKMDSISTNNKKGYVELSYLVKYPKSILYRPQYLVKNILDYDEFAKVANDLYITDENKQLLKIVRYLPDNSTEVLFETDDLKGPFQLFDAKHEDSMKETGASLLKSLSISSSTESSLTQTINNESEFINKYDIVKFTREGTGINSQKKRLTEDNLNLKEYQDSFKYANEKHSKFYRNYEHVRSPQENLEPRANFDKIIGNSDGTITSNVQNYGTGINFDDSGLNNLNVNAEDSSVVKSFAVENNAAVSMSKDSINSNASSTPSQSELAAEFIRYANDNLKSEESNINSNSQVLEELRSQVATTGSISDRQSESWWENWKNQLIAQVKALSIKVIKLLNTLKGTKESTNTEENSKAKIKENAGTLANKKLQRK